MSACCMDETSEQFSNSKLALKRQSLSWDGSFCPFLHDRAGTSRRLLILSVLLPAKSAIVRPGGRWKRLL